MAKYKLILFLTGTTAKSQQAREAFNRLCDDYLKGDCQRALVDVLEFPELAEEYRILATPTLIRESPLPLKRIIGDLTDSQRLLSALEVDTRVMQEKGNMHDST